MKYAELVKRREEIQAKLKDSGLAEKCVRVAMKLGKDRGSSQGDAYTNENYLYEKDGLVIDCDVGQNMQGDGRLFVVSSGKTVFGNKRVAIGTMTLACNGSTDTVPAAGMTFTPADVGMRGIGIVFFETNNGYIFKS